ncbi:5448_t:CDS:2 [Paraglomus brasilianum]|uniref:5448_t:CDS:1 n=1 Tax=Paraglomus brasilianum TaxID=144538 RepID=A0A9N8VBG0_9GLOM|nr:5448_t:CDS:2 [Paraglomus brasilianum]
MAKEDNRNRFFYRLLAADSTRINGWDGNSEWRTSKNLTVINRSHRQNRRYDMLNLAAIIVGTSTISRRRSEPENNDQLSLVRGADINKLANGK